MALKLNVPRKNTLYDLLWIFQVMLADSTHLKKGLELILHDPLSCRNSGII